MIDDVLKRELIEHKIFSAWQFMEYTEKNIATVEYCANTIDSLIKKMTMKTVRWQQDISADFVDDVTEDGKPVKRLSVTTENSPTYEVRVAGEKVDPWFLFDKLLRDFFQYIMNSFDSISQIINAGLLANRGKKVDSCDIQMMIKCFDQQTYSTSFPQMHAWLDNLSNSTEFQYIEAINNRTKHTADIANKLSMGILGSPNTTQIGSFFRKGEPHEKKELNDQLQASFKFLKDSWKDFLNVFKAEYVKDIYTENRRHNITGVRQQKLKDQPGQDLSYAYISAETTFDAMPDEIYVLLVNDNGEDVFAHESPFSTILVTGDTNINVLGRYIVDEEIGDDCLLHYRKYIKDKNVQGISCVFCIQREKNVFYHKNPYFNVESVSDDQEFLMRTSLPF